MSSINNIPFDINRAQVETNSTRPKNASSPVNQTEAAKSAAQSVKIKERRNAKKDRRKQQLSVQNERRHLKQRRQSSDTANTQVTAESLSDTRKASGTIIDIEV